MKGKDSGVLGVRIAKWIIIGKKREQRRSFGGFGDFLAGNYMYNILRILCVS